MRRGRAHARSLPYARILLKTDDDASEGGPAWTDERIAEALETGADTVARESAGASRGTGSRWRSDAREARQTPGRRVPDGRAEAHLVALGCAAPPEGRGRWTRRLLADRMVEPGHVEGLSRRTVSGTLKKTGRVPTWSRSG